MDMISKVDDCGNDRVRTCFSLLLRNDFVKVSAVLASVVQSPQILVSALISALPSPPVNLRDPGTPRGGRRAPRKFAPLFRYARESGWQGATLKVLSMDVIEAKLLRKTG